MTLPSSLGRSLSVVLGGATRIIPIPPRPRTRVLVVLNEREVLLVKNWFGRQLWTLPGGGVRYGEAPEKAAVRELREETGLIVDPSELIFIGEMENAGFPPRLLVFRVDVRDTDSAASIPHHARHEITDLRWHPLINLPIDRVALVDEALAR